MYKMVNKRFNTLPIFDIIELVEECAMGFFRKLIDSEYKELKRFEKIALKIDALSD